MYDRLDDRAEEVKMWKVRESEENSVLSNTIHAMHYNHWASKRKEGRD